MSVKHKLVRFYERLPAYVSLLRRGQLGKVIREQRAYMAGQRQLMEEFRAARPEFAVVEDIRDRRSGGVQRTTYDIAQFWYASNQLARLKPSEIYDVGSHRSWLTGVAAGLDVHYLDVRPPDLSVPTETFHAGVAEKLPWPSDSVDCLTSLCALEHFGLGSYGDPYDPDADVKAIAEMLRVLKPGGHLILTTLCTGRKDSFVRFNAGRVYSLGRLREMFAAFELLDEAFYSMPQQGFVDRTQLQTALAPAAWDVYFGTWRKLT